MSETLDKLVKEAHEGKVVYHVSRDSTAVEAREKLEKKEKTEKKRCERPKKGENRSPKEETVIGKQIHETTEESLKNINTSCVHGYRKNRHGNIQFWTGYKLHLDVSDCRFPLGAFVSGATVYDSQPACDTTGKDDRGGIFSCYSLMDVAYDSSVIDGFIRSRERIPLIDPNNRGSETRPPLDPVKKERFKLRTEVERANSILKDWFLPRKLYVKGPAKVSFVVLIAVVCLAALRMIQYFVL
ncbi:MAG: hypothetical protein LBK13_06620 [Spirochaetales bacterium]|jgi:hypothetical protein|nr:hypothetical protein [Spirochaetales bacterium]